MTRTENNLRGIAVAVSDYKEKDKMVRAVTVRGVKSLILRGVKSDKAKLKFAASLFSTIDYFGMGDEMVMVTGANAVEMRYALAEDVKKFAAAEVIAEAVSKCLGEDGDSTAEFALLDLALSSINDGDYDPLAVLVWALCKLLTVEGVDFEDYTLGKGVKTLFRALRDADIAEVGSLDFTEADFVGAANSAERLLNHALGLRLKSLVPVLSMLNPL